MMAQACDPSYSGSEDRKIVNLRPAWTKVGRLYPKDKSVKKKKKGLGVRLKWQSNNKHKALNSISSTTKNKNKELGLFCPMKYCFLRWSFFFFFFRIFFMIFAILICISHGLPD
jgi:hypothetical protein